MKKKYPFVKQVDLKDCASACTLMIIKYYHGFVKKSKLDEMLKINKNGTTAYHIVATLKSLGFEAYGLKCDLEELKQKPQPFIANVIINNSYKHFVVVYEVYDDYLLIADPAKKIIKMSKDNFKEIWTGVSLHMYPLKPIIKMKNVSTFNFLKNLVISNSAYLVLTFVLSLFVTFLSIGTSFLFQIIIDNIKNNLSTICIFFFILFISKNILDFFKNKLIISLNKKIDKQVTTGVFKKIIYLPYNYYQRKTSGEIISRINDLNYVKDFIGNTILSLFSYVPLIVLTLGLMFYLNSILFMVAVSILIFYIIIIMLYKNKIKELIFEENYEKASTHSYMVEAIRGIETIKGLGVEEKVINKFNTVFLKKVNSVYKLDNFYNKIYLLKELINTICQILVIFIGTVLVKNGDMTLGTLLTYFVLMTYLFMALNSILDFDFQIKEVKEAVERILDLTYYKEESLVYKILKGNIIIQNLNYSYDDVKTILKNISLKISPGEKILISGQSGSGKSTLLKIIKKFYPVKGKVKIDGIDISKLDVKAINNSIVYIGQNETLFTGTIHDNLTLRGSNYQKQMQASMAFEITSKDSLGIYMLIEENGSNLSGGQKQRLVLARALQNFKVILIDEGFSSVDVNMERRILKNMFKMYPDKTIIVVSHRLDNLDLFDRLIKMHQGQIILDTKREW